MSELLRKVSLLSNSRNIFLPLGGRKPQRRKVSGRQKKERGGEREKKKRRKVHPRTVSVTFFVFLVFSPRCRK